MDPTPDTPIELNAEKQAQKDQIHKAIELQVGRPPVNAQESRKRAAMAEVLAGEPMADVERRYAIAQQELIRYIKQVFPTDQDRFEFLENCMLTNATLAGAKFVEGYSTMTAPEAAKAMAIFAKGALEIRKAREQGFKEAPVNVGIILTLQDTLSKLTNGTQTES